MPLTVNVKLTFCEHVDLPELDMSLTLVSSSESRVLGIPKKYRRLINNTTNVFSLISRISFILDKAYPNLDFEIKVDEIG